MPTIIRDISYDQWSDAIRHANFVALQQSWGYGEAARDFGVQITRFAIEDDSGTILGLAQLTHKKLMKWLPLSLCMRGPVWLSGATDDLKRDAYQLLRRQKFYSLWMPEDKTDAPSLLAAKASRVMTGYHTMMLDLSQPIETLRAQLDAKWRNRLVAAEKAPLKIARLKQPKDYRFLLEAEAEQSASRHYSALHPMLVPLYQMHLGEGSVLAFSANQQHQPVAALLCLIHDGCATYHIGWSNAQGKAQNAHNLLLWRAIKALKAQGARWLDLGGLNTDKSPGIARFKIGTGGEIKSLAGTFF